jgi:CTP:molybdopterin cytidylyltransferase MocA
VTPSRWHCVIAAGGAAPGEIARATGAKTKAAVDLLGATSLVRVLDACRAVGFASITVVADQDPAPNEGLEQGERVVQPGETNIHSILNGLAGLPDDAPTFLTPCDVPLMQSDHIWRFLDALEARWRETEVGRWFAMGLADEPEVRRRYPDVPYRYIRLREGRFAAGALYASTPTSIRHAARELGIGSKHRKSIARLVLRFGLIGLVRYHFGFISIAEAERRVGEILGGKCFVVTGCDPATTMDFDTLDELRHVERLLREQEAK